MPARPPPRPPRASAPGRTDSTASNRSVRSGVTPTTIVAALPSERDTTATTPKPIRALQIVGKRFKLAPKSPINDVAIKSDVADALPDGRGAARSGIGERPPPRKAHARLLSRRSFRRRVGSGFCGHPTNGSVSIRIPAAQCGLFALKPSHDRVSMAPDAGEGWGGLSAEHVVGRRCARLSAHACTARLEPGDPYTAGERGIFPRSHLVSDAQTVEIAGITSSCCERSSPMT